MEKKLSDSKLLRRWTMSLAYELMDEFPLMDRSAALKQSYLVRELLEALGKGVAEFEYVKVNGERRNAVGTLCERLIPPQQMPSEANLPKSRNAPLVFCYYDIERKGWRSFRAQHLTEICGVVIRQL